MYGWGEGERAAPHPQTLIDKAFQRKGEGHLRQEKCVSCRGGQQWGIRFLQIIAEIRADNLSIHFA